MGEFRSRGDGRTIRSFVRSFAVRGSRFAMDRDGSRRVSRIARTDRVSVVTQKKALRPIARDSE
jgi:hypothetical protein